MRRNRTILGICFLGLIFAASSSAAEENLPEAVRHRWRPLPSQHKLAMPPGVVTNSESCRYHATYRTCVEGPGACDVAV